MHWSGTIRPQAGGGGTAAAAILALAAACGGLPGRGAGQAPAGDVRLISRGEAVDLREHLAAGKFTLFDFYADWCPPCWEVEPELERLARESDRVAVRKINIVDWTTPVVRQHGVQELPHLLLYDPEGTLLAAGDDALHRAREIAGPGPEGPAGSG